jgi:transcriptional antiterminator NusG
VAKKWYVIHTYSGYESKVKGNIEHMIESEGLGDRIFKVEIPSETVTEIREGGKRVPTERKIFPGYVLVRMDLDDEAWSMVRSIPGVTGFVGAEGTPSPLTRDEYEKIMRRVKVDDPKKTSSDIEVGQSIKVVSGPLVDFDGIVTEVNPETGKIRVTVSIFGRETPVELGFNQIQKN